MRPISSSGWRTVVIAGSAIRAIVESSNPTTGRSSETRMPQARASCRRATAMSSLQAKIAVGGSGRSSSSAAATRPSMVSNSPPTSSRGSSGTPASVSAAR
jgi:hypothetical protein